MRELKQCYIINVCTLAAGRTFTGAWIETINFGRGFIEDNCRTFTGAWIETGEKQTDPFYFESHLHGCVNWNSFEITVFSPLFMSHLHGCVNWNQQTQQVFLKQLVAPSRVRELKPYVNIWAFRLIKVAPSRVRELKHLFCCISSVAIESHLHGCVNWNCF